MARIRVGSSRGIAEEALAGAATLGEAMQRYRQSARLPLRELARRLGVSAQHLHDVEHGERRLKPGRAAAWAMALGIPARVLVQLALQQQVEGLGLRVRVEAA